MSAERITFLQFRIRFLEHLKLDVAVSSLAVSLIRVFEGHESNDMNNFGRGCQIFPRHNVLVTLPPFAALG